MFTYMKTHWVDLVYTATIATIAAAITTQVYTPIQPARPLPTEMEASYQWCRSSILEQVIWDDSDEAAWIRKYLYLPPQTTETLDLLSRPEREQISDGLSVLFQGKADDRAQGETGQVVPPQLPTTS